MKKEPEKEKGKCSPKAQIKKGLEKDNFTCSPGA
jgi:hypothetical protein